MLKHRCRQAWPASCHFCSFGFLFGHLQPFLICLTVVWICYHHILHEMDGALQSGADYTTSTLMLEHILLLCELMQRAKYMIPTVTFLGKFHEWCNYM